MSEEKVFFSVSLIISDMQLAMVNVSMRICQLRFRLASSFHERKAGTLPLNLKVQQVQHILLCLLIVFSARVLSHFGQDTFNAKYCKKSSAVQSALSCATFFFLASCDGVYKLHISYPEINENLKKNEATG